MKKRHIRYICLVVAFVLLGSVLAACGGSDKNAPAPSASQAQQPQQSEQPAAPAKKIEFIANFQHAQAISPNWERVCNEIVERSNGVLDTAQIYWSGALLSMAEVPMGLSTGQASFCNLPTNNYVDIFPLNCRIIQMPFMGLKEANSSAEIYEQLYREFPEMQKELEDYGIIAIGAKCLGYYCMHFVDKNPVHTPQDLAGRQMIPYKMEFLPLLSEVNAGGTFIPPPQAYEALEKNVADGYINNWAFAAWFGTTEIMQQHVNFGEYGAFQEFNILAFSKAFMDSLPADVQQTIRDIVWNEGGYRSFYADTYELVKDQKKIAEEKGDLIITLTPAEIEVWKEALLPQHKIALDEICEARGDDVAYKIYERALELIAEKARD